ncbi:MAG: sugar phosphate isomerase/epimerase [Anaerolineales bacterium]|nr:sugar phosphate isomerase/epimerase [Anaerolineales bacterium]
MPRLSISSWSLHRALGEVHNHYHATPAPRRDNDNVFGELTLLQLPEKLAARGIHTLEICHFHLPSLDDGYLAELRGALAAAGVSLFSILIDDGDITHPDPAQREADMAWIRGWVAVAGKCGAAKARVIAGQQAAQPANALSDAPQVQLSASQLRSLAAFAQDYGVAIITENFRELTATAAPLLAILQQCEGQVGLCADFGNFRGASKYDDLAAILPYADSVHAKAQYVQPGQVEEGDFRRCLGLAKTAVFDGPYSLIFDGVGNEWANIAVLQGVVGEYV